jgi:hypothetical protein
VWPIGTSDWPYFGAIRRKIFFRNTFAIADPKTDLFKSGKTVFFRGIWFPGLFLEFFFTFSIQFTMLILEFFTPTL